MPQIKEEKKLLKEDKKQLDQNITTPPKKPKVVKIPKKVTKPKPIKKVINKYDILKFIKLTTKNIKNLKEYKVHSCSEKGRSYYIVGPFESNQKLNEAFKKIFKNIDNQASKIDIIKLEYDKICK